MIKLDKKDKQIIYQLDLNSRQSSSEIGKKLRLSKEVVNYRIKNLLKKGIIKRFYTVIDTAKLGFTSYKVYIQFQNVDREKEQEIVNFFTKHPRIFWVAACSGRWDLLIGVWAEDITDFDKILKDILNKYSGNILSKEITITTGVPMFRREWIIDKKIRKTEDIRKAKKIYIGGKLEKAKLDQIDEELLKSLANNARMPIKDLAQRCNISSSLVIHRIKQLIKKGVIQTFRVALDLTKLNYEFCKSFIYLQNITTEKEKQLISFCGLNPNLIHITRCVGPWDIEFEFEVESFEQFHTMMKDIKSKFAEIIKNYESVLISKEHRLDFMPGCYGSLT